METKTYLKNICNFLNNTKGFITDYEVKFLLKCIDDREYNITGEVIEELSDYVENDNQNAFAEKLFKVEMESRI